METKNVIKVRFLGYEPEILEGYVTGDYKKRYYYRWTGQEVKVRWGTLTPDGYIMVEIIKGEEMTVEERLAILERWCSLLESNISIVNKKLENLNKKGIDQNPILDPAEKVKKIKKIMDCIRFTKTQAVSDRDYIDTVHRALYFLEKELKDLFSTGGIKKIIESDRERKENDTIHYKFPTVHYKFRDESENSG